MKRGKKKKKSPRGAKPQNSETQKNWAKASSPVTEVSRKKLRSKTFEKNVKRHTSKKKRSKTKEERSGVVGVHRQEGLYSPSVVTDLKVSPCFTHTHTHAYSHTRKLTTRTGFNVHELC